MLIRYGFRLSFDVPQQTAVLARLDIHPSRRSDIVSESPLLIGGQEAPPAIKDVHGNLCRRLTAPPGRSQLEMSGVVRDCGVYEAQMTNEPLWPVADLPNDALVYLLASRYCETDQVSNTAWQLFGHLPSDATRVRGVVDYVHSHLTFATDSPGQRAPRTSRSANALGCAGTSLT